jgi:hypothetical protein
MSGDFRQAAAICNEIVCHAIVDVEHMSSEHVSIVGRS